MQRLYERGVDEQDLVLEVSSLHFLENLNELVENLSHLSDGNILLFFRVADGNENDFAMFGI